MLQNSLCQHYNPNNLLEIAAIIFLHVREDDKRQNNESCI